jgi:hypothetical protein
MESARSYLEGLPAADRRRFRERITAAVLAVELCRRCVEAPGPESATVAQLREYLGQAIGALQEAQAALPDAS